MNWKWWLLLVLTVILSFFSSYAGARENNFSVLEDSDKSSAFDSLNVGFLADSTVIPSIGIYPYPWGKTIYIDTTTFSKYGLLFFFDPFDKECRKSLKILSGMAKKLEQNYKYRVFVIMVSESLNLSREVSKNKREYTACLLPHFPNERGITEDSLRKVANKLESAWPLYRLSRPIQYVFEEHGLPFLALAKGPYIWSVAPNLQFINSLHAKLTFAVCQGQIENWHYRLAKGGDKK
jgi:hypothetical protein